MCGFLGWRKKSGEAWAPEETACRRAALEFIHHRGPDDTSEIESDGTWLGFKRLSILDLSVGGRQPMTFGSGRYALVFNGEIYNFRELHKEMGSPDLPSTGDSVVLGMMLSTMPVNEVLGRLRGMFAFAWWDRLERQLVVARDPYGIKPVFYQEGEDGALTFGSELRAVARLGRAAPEVSRKALAQYFRWGAVQAPETMLDGIRCLPPGAMLKWSQDKVEIERYVKPRWPGRDAWVVDQSEQKERVREVLLGAVKAHLVSDVEVGVFLSGGLDSTLMAACMKELGNSHFKAFSIGYEEGSGVPDETDAAERTARYFGCEFVRERLSAKVLLGRLDSYFDSLDQPSGDALNTWLASRLAAQSVKVTLSGLGADEWFAGYNGMRLMTLFGRVKAVLGPVTGVSGAFARLMSRIAPDTVQGKRLWKAFYYGAGGAGQTPGDLHAFSRTILDPCRVAQLLGCSPDRVEEETLHTPERDQLLAELDDRAPDALINKILMQESETYLPNTLLRDNDCTSMAHSLELRVPLVDREVFALAGIMPPDAKISLSGGKLALRAAMSDLLPEWIRDDHQKKTFTLPLMKWMRTPGWRERIHDVLGSQDCRERGLVDADVSRNLLERYERVADDTKSGWRISQVVWMLFVLESWAATNLPRLRG